MCTTALNMFTKVSKECPLLVKETILSAWRGQNVKNVEKNHLKKGLISIVIIVKNRFGN